MKKTVLVTGAGGYIGRHVTKKLIDIGFKVIACDVTVNEIDDRAEFLPLNIFCNDKNIFRLAGEPDICLHMAWKDGFNHNSESHMKNLSNHYTFLKNMIDGGLSHLAVMGTMHEVGYHEGAIDENTTCNPTSMYGIAKDALRRSLFQMANDKKGVFQWLRAYYIFGDDLRNKSIFTKLIEAEKKGTKRFPFTSGKNKYDFIHVNELVEQIIATINQNEIVGVINCCSGQPVSLGEKVEAFIKEHNMDIRLSYGAFSDRAYDSPAVWGDSAKINMILKNK